MFLHQKLNYKYTHIENDTELKTLTETFKKHNPDIIVYDTETTGLHSIKDVPFLIAVGFRGYVYTFDKRDKYIQEFYHVAKDCKFLFAHNAKYDWHMMYNSGNEMPEDINLADSVTLARLTQYSDDLGSLTLESLGERYVDPESKFAGKVIKKHISKIKAKRWGEMKDVLKIMDLPGRLKEVTDAYKKRVQFIPHKWDELFDYMDELYTEPNYEDSYKENPNLMRNYAADDVVITLEYIFKALPVLEHVDPGLKIFTQENKLIRVVGHMERVGLKLDIPYLIESRKKMHNYQKELYKKLWAVTKVEVGSGQHKLIKHILKVEYGIETPSVDKDHLKALVKQYTDDGNLTIMLQTISKLRTVDKWLSTYVEGKLNKVYKGRVYTSIHNAGTVTGRVSSDLQQEPKKGLKDDNGVELFHPRRAVVNEEGFRMFYFDYSQMELRMQAHYTVELSGGDKNLCSAFVPFMHRSMFDGRIYKLGDADWNSEEWVDENFNLWDPTDLHSATALKAFPETQKFFDRGGKNDPDFETPRGYGKRCNFLKNYGGGAGAVMDSLGVSEEIANKLDKGYYEAFPLIRDYQRWVEDELSQKGWIENIFGRRYYMRSSNWFYKVYNYMIQGGCADVMKEKEIEVFEFFKAHPELKSKMVLPVHDEVQVAIAHGEEWIAPLIKEIMEDTLSYLPTIPMICDVEFTDSNWADKEDYIYES